MRALIGMLAVMTALAQARLALAGEAPSQAKWRYEVPPENDRFAHPPLRVLALSERRPDDLAEVVKYRGKRHRYAQLRYGTPSSVRITIVVDEVGPEEVDLYIDRNRDRTIRSADKVAGAKLTWQLPLEVAIVKDNDIKFEPRAVIFRYGRFSHTLSYATCGYMEGQVRLGEVVRAARRVDGDGNGFCTDSQDRLWIDLDGSGRWDPVRDQFPFAPILAIEGQRYIVQSDPLGERLSLSPLTGTGTVRLTVPPRPGRELVELTTMLASRDGIVATLSGNGAEAVLPVGDYRFTMLSATARDPKSGQYWSYLFSENRNGRRQWHTLDRDRLLILDAVGRLEFTCEAGSGGTCQAGGDLAVHPALCTGDGLVITAVVFGRQISSIGSDGPQARVVLSGTDRKKQAEAFSGFA